ncbi:flagellar hook-basal body complex protein [Guptibacillus algicola]|uniref:flagellar hook-basal body complex protein n=1 Tax=Guptibacillus algicola TaxID=225844 RepID=UPI001CD298C8|nr:flagellar hook-basal body complex protein [Alkalihalobacillus algicola]MCA0988915.1 flagellar hook-basal body complex protein [Alkalihalobacillus algicola]
MLRSMYSGVSGMKGFNTKLDVIGNNIANVNTVGFKKSRVMFQDLLSQNMGDRQVNSTQVGLGVTEGSIDTLHTTGSFMTTGVQSDLSIEGDGYFRVQREITTDNGTTKTPLLTRSGNFYVNNDSELVTSQGYFVLDEAGEKIKLDEPYTINRQGEISKINADGEPVFYTKISMGTVSNPSGLTKDGGSMYEETTKSGVFKQGLPESSRVVSGQLEMSNVDLTEEFTEMIVAQRGFQANSRVITTSDEILQEIVNLKR